MSKTFKSAYPGRSNQSLGIVRADNRVRVSVDHGSDGARGIIIAPSDAPALALSALEAAGVVPKWDENGSIGTPEHLAHIQWHLKQYIEAQEAIAAQAEETAKLEAEALELRNAFSMAIGGASIDSFVGHSLNKPGWIDAARCAREIAKEATK